MALRARRLGFSDSALLNICDNHGAHGVHALPRTTYLIDATEAGVSVTGPINPESVNGQFEASKGR